MLLLLFIFNILECVILYKEEKKLILFNVPIFFISLSFFYNEMILLSLVIPFLIGQILIDFKKMELSDINNIMLFIASIFYGIKCGFNAKSFLILLMTSIFLYLLSASKMGFGDVKFFCSIALFIPDTWIIPFIFYTFLVALGIGVITKILKNKNEFPMGPAISTISIIFLLLIEKGIIK